MFLKKRFWKFSLVLTIAVLAVFFLWPEAKANPLAQNLKIRASLPNHNQKTSVTVEKNQTKKQFQVNGVDQEKPIYYSVSNLGARTINPQAVINGFDWFTDRSIVNFALKDIDFNKATDEEKVLALLNFVVNNRYHWSPALYETSYYFVGNPVQYLNTWGYGFCGNSSRILIQLLALAGYETRLVNLADHIVGEVFYGGSWHALDPDMEVYYRNSSGAVANTEEIVDNNQLLDSPNWLNDIDDEKKAVVKQVMIKAYSNPPWRYTPVEESMESKDYQDELIYRLRPNEKIRFYYDFKGKFYWSYKDEPPPEFTNGVLVSQNRGGLVRLELPFPIVAAYIYKPGLCQVFLNSRFSLNGIFWKKLSNCQDDVLILTDLFPVGENSRPTEKFYLTLPFSLTDYQILTQFQTAPKSIPRLNPGVNEIELKNPLNSAIKLKFGFSRYIE